MRFMALPHSAGAPKGERRESLGTEASAPVTVTATVSAPASSRASSVRTLVRTLLRTLLASRADSVAVVPARAPVVLTQPRALILVALLVVVLLGVITAGCGPPN
jgi:hypothetical protein